MKREPILFIRGSKERAEGIRHILEDEWGGNNCFDVTFDKEEYAHFIDHFGNINYAQLSGDEYFENAIKGGWMKEYVLPEQPKFKTFDKVVVRISRAKWYADLYSHEDEDCIHFIGHSTYLKEETIVLPYNEETAKLIGTNDEWEGGDNE